MQNPRECALDVLIKVDKKEELSHIAISNVLEKYQFSEKRDRAFFTRLVEGTLERQITIDYVADQFSSDLFVWESIRFFIWIRFQILLHVMRQ